MSSPRLDPRVPLPVLVQRLAHERPDDVAVISIGQGSITWLELAQSAHSWALWLAGHGVRAGDRVATLVPQSLEACYLWLACAELGAVEASVNPEFRGEWLRHAIDVSGCRVVVSAGPSVPELELVLPELDVDHVLIPDRPGLPAPDTTYRPPAPAAAMSIGDPGCILYTSGTTGPSKPVLLSWGVLYNQASVDQFDDPASEVFYVPYAPHHLSGRSALYRGALTGGRTVIRDGFSTTAFWSDVRQHGCTWTILYAAPARYLTSQAPLPDDSDNPLTRVLLCPVLPEADALQERFGFSAYSVYGSTEVGSPLRLDAGDCDSAHAGACGRPVPGVQARLVDAADQEVQPRAPGELVLRTDAPWMLMTEYQGAPEATARAWRNGWFHTGDLMTRDTDGVYWFVDRAKDSIRRRGENISSVELESAVQAHRHVVAAAAFGVPSEYGDEDVFVAVVADDRSTFDPADLIDHLLTLVPGFAVPTYVRVVDELPRTQATMRVQKHLLRSEGVTADTWRRRTAHRTARPSAAASASASGELL